ncbi:MAG: PhoH family protein [Acutalibacteraceae bacterium]
MFEQTVDIERIEDLINLFGNFDENIKYIEKKYDVSITSIGNRVKVKGDPLAVNEACRTIKGLITMINKGEQITAQSIDYIASLVADGEDESISCVVDADCICITAKGKPVKPKTVGQKTYVEAIEKNTVTICVGPAGTGKTYLAVAQAVSAFRAKEISRIILTRPAVEAGESLGFLPGDLHQKIDPYLRPLYDALFDMLGAENFQKCQERGDIEVAPLAYMRGRTLDDSFIILDEAQNTTCEQMKMFLTRLGFNSKAVVTGDVTQIDLPKGKKSGLTDAIRILKNIEGISIIHLSGKDVVRHRLVQAIIKAYERNSEKNEYKSEHAYKRNRYKIADRHKNADSQGM